MKIEDVKRMGEAVLDGADDITKSANGGEAVVSSGLRDLGDGVRRLWGGGKQKFTSVLNTGEAVVQRNPGISVLSCCGIGLVMGSVLGWILAKEEREARSFADKFLRRWGHRLHID